MRSPALDELPAPPPEKYGWPWTEESPQLPESRPDGSPWPGISIVTPSYNQGQFIEETIRSVLLQGYPNLEYMIVDGGSSDESVDIIKKYEQWLAYWVTEPDRGQSHAVNKGLEVAEGEILAYLNSDDLYAPNCLTPVSNYFSTHPEAKMVYGDCYLINEAGDKFGSYPAEGYENFLDLVDYQYYGKLIIPQPTVFWRKEIIKTVGLLNENYELAMDYEYWLRCAFKYNLHYINRYLACYRVRTTTKTGMFRYKQILEVKAASSKYWDHLPAFRRNRGKLLYRLYLKHESITNYLQQLSSNRQTKKESVILTRSAHVIAVVLDLIQNVSRKLHRIIVSLESKKILKAK